MPVNEAEATRIMKQVYERTRAVCEDTMRAESNSSTTALGMVEGVAHALVCIAAPHVSRAGFLESMGAHYDTAHKMLNDAVVRKILK